MPRSPSLLPSAGLLLLLCGAATFACAQDLATGAVGGVILDAQGRAIPNARIHLANAATAMQRDALSDAQGEFLFGQIAPGTVSLRVQRDGFAPENIPDFAVAVGQTGRIELHLHSGTANETVDVRADDAERPSLANSPLKATLSPEELLTLPIDGRRFQSFALLTPLVNLADTPSDTDIETTTDGTTDETSADVSSDAVRLSVRGLDPSQNTYAQDGTSATRSYDGEPRGGALLPFNVPLEGVREFQVRVVGTGTPLGRDIGGSVHAVTRRGEEALHGAAFFLLRNSGVGAADPFAIATHYNNGAPTSQYVKPRDLREQFGGSLGRALPHTGKRLFLFASAEQQRRSFPGIASPNNPNFFRLTPTQSALLGNRGVSQANVAKALNFLDNLGGQVDRHANTLAFSPRLDWQRGSRTTATLTYNRVRHDSPSGQRNTTIIPSSRDNIGTLSTHADTLQLSYSQALSRRWLNELRLGASRDGTFVQQTPPLPQEPHSAPGGASPQVTIDLANASTGGAFTFGTPVSLSKRRLPVEQRAEVYETLTFSGRAHTVTMGAGGSLIDTAVETGLATSGAYRYASGATGGRAGGLVDFITDATFSATAYPNGGCPSIFAATHLFCFQSYTQGFGPAKQLRFHTGEASAFLSDAWRLTPHLRISAGARYEYFRMPLPQHTNAALDAVFGSFAATNYFPGDPGNVAPHLSIAYGITDRTVIRLGYGIHFGRVTGSVLQRVLQNTAQPASSYQIHLTSRTEVEQQCASIGTNFGYPATYNCTPSARLAQTTGATVLAQRFQLPMVQDAELTLEHEFPRGIHVSASYALALERELPNTTDLNIAPSTQRAVFRIVRPNGGGEPGAQDGYVFNVPLYTTRISPLFGPVTAVLSNGTGTHNAGVLQVTRVSPHGLTLRMAYTFSKAVDSVRYSGAGIDTDAQFDPRDETYDKAASNFNRPQKLVASAVWAPQLQEASRPLRLLANGWSVAPIVFATSGRPYSYLVQGGTLLTGGRTSLNGSGGATYLPTVGRNTLRLPPTQNVDLRILRGFTFHGNVRARLSAEAFNLLNRRNLTGVQQRAFLAGIPVNGITPLTFQDTATIAAEGLTTRPFGTPTSSATQLTRERRVQFGLRFDW